MSETGTVQQRTTDAASAAGHRFDGRVALVTGAGSGLGYQHAVTLARLGAQVMVQDVRSEHGATPEEATAAEVADLLRSEGYDVEADQGTVGDEAYCEGLVQRTIDRFGKLDILINNAGCLGWGTVQDTTTDALRASLDVNLLGSFWTMRAAVRHMRDRNYGRIINTASGAAAFGLANDFAYITAKAGVLGMSKAAALDNVDKDIRINAFCPIAYTVMAREHFDNMPNVDRAILDTRLVTPVALYLVHEDCAITGEVISAGAGKWSRIITGKTEGTTQLTQDIEDVFASLDRIMDTTNFTIPASARAQY